MARIYVSFEMRILQENFWVCGKLQKIYLDLKVHAIRDVMPSWLVSSYWYFKGW